MTGFVRLRRVGWILLLCLGGALLAEALIRVRLYFQTGAFGFAHTFVFDESSGLRIPKPGRQTAKLSIDSRGFRNPELELPKPVGRLRLAFLGGSTTFCAEVTGNENTWPALVCAGLQAAFPARDFDYINAGVGGYASDSSLVNLNVRVAPLEPDIIFICHATNDLTKESRALAQGQGLYTGHGDEEDWLSQYSLGWQLLRKNLTYQSRLRQAAAARGRLVFEPAALTVGFHKNLTALVRRAKEVAPLVVLLTFTQRARPGQDAGALLESSSSSLYYMPYMSPEGIRDAFLEYNKIIAEVAGECGTILIAGEDEIPSDEDHFTDSVHLTRLGCSKMSERILTRLRDRPELHPWR